MRELLPSVKKLLHEIESSRNKLLNIQNKCEHPEQDCEHIHCTGPSRWHPLDEEYRIHNKCYRCGKDWTTEYSSWGTRVQKFSN